MENTQEKELVNTETQVDNGQVESEEVETNEAEVEETDVEEVENESPKDNVEVETETAKEEATEEEMAKRAHYAELKRQKKAQEKAIKESTPTNNTSLEVNEFTGLPIEDDADRQEYQEMLAAKAKGIDPTNIREYSKYRKEAKKQAELNARLAALEEENRVMKEEKEKKAWFENDRKLFVEKYPDVDIAALGNTKSFANYADGKIGNKPLVEIYEGWLEGIAEHKAEVEDEKNKALARAKSSPGSFGNSEIVENKTDAYTEYKRLLRLAKQGKI